MNKPSITLALAAALVLTPLTTQQLWGDEEDDVIAAFNEAVKLQKQAKYSQATEVYEKALRLAIGVYGEKHQGTATILNNLGLLHSEQGKYAEAEPLYQRSLAIREKILGNEHPQVAATLNNLAILYWRQDKYAQAEPLYRRSLSIREKVLGEEHPGVADSLSNLAALCNSQGKFAEAERLVRRSLAIREKISGKDHPDVATTIHNLATVYHDQGKYAEAEPLYQRSLAIRERALGKEHPAVAMSLNNLANLCSAQGKYAEAESLYQRSLAISEKFHGKEHPNVAESINNLANLCRNQAKQAEAESLYLRSLAIREKVFGKDHPAVATALSSLANLYSDQGKYIDAELLYLRSLAIREKVLGKEHSDIAQSLHNLADLYRDQGKYLEAEPLYQRSLAISEKVLGKEHPHVALSLNNLANLYANQGKYAEAEPLFQRSLANWERVLGKEHPNIVGSLFNLAVLSVEQRDLALAVRYTGRVRRQSRLFFLRELQALSVHEQMQFLSQDENRRFAYALSLGYRHAENSSICTQSAEWLLNGKANASEAQSQQVALQCDVQDTEGKAILRRLQELRARESALALKLSNNSQRQAIIEQREKLEAERRDLEKQLAQRGGAAARLAEPWVELDALRKALPADGILIDIARFAPWRFGAKNGEPKRDPSHYVAWVIPPKGNIQIVDLGEAEPIDAAVKSARQAMAQAALRLAKDTDEAMVEAETSERLAVAAKLVLAPLKPHLAGVKKLVLSPDGDLWLLPWAALPVAKDRYLVEDVSLRLVVSGRDLVSVPLAKQPERGPALIVADPDYDLASASVLLGQRCPGKIEKWNVSFDFGADGKLAIYDEDNGSSLAGTGSWSLQGDTLTMKTKIAEFTGKLSNNAVSGERLVRPDDAPAKTDHWEMRLTAGESRALSHEAKLIPRARRLGGTSAEARSATSPLKKLSGKEPVMRQQAEATEGAVKAVKSPAVLMLATHGFFLKRQEIDMKDEKPRELSAPTHSVLRAKDGSEVEDPLQRCGLLLAGANRREERKSGEEDGILTGLEIVGLDLRGTKLVILSACDTGVGDVHNGQGVAGLRQAFQLAGAEGVLATLWPVNDRETVRLMDGFYSGLAQDGDKAEALTMAQRKFIKERRERYGAAHPYFWAGFTMTGK